MMSTYQLFKKNLKDELTDPVSKAVVPPVENGEFDQKSPVMAMRELAKSNQLQPVFGITNEDGPPHDKTFSVTLTLGAQTWQGTGKSIKKAQMDAASKALQECDFPKLMKNSKKIKIANPSSLTPTVLLNGLAMARGEPVKYRVVSKVPLPTQPIYTDPTKYYYDFGNMYADAQQPFHVPFQYNFQRRYQNNKPMHRWIQPQLFRVEVAIGDRTFLGEGKSQQAARHNAAQKALDLLQTMPVPTKTKKAVRKNAVDKPETDVDDGGDKTQQKIPKSPISELYETASAHRLKVDFAVTSEAGLPHLKLFTLKVVIEKHAKGEEEPLVSAEGQGPNKNVAKTKAAEAALVKLKEISLPPRALKDKKKLRSKKSGNTSNAEDLTTVLHPVSRLTQIMQAKKQKEPTYTVVTSSTKTSQRDTSFVIKCTAMEKSAEGEGRSKREAKRAAAENLLKELGFLTNTGSVASKAPGKPAVKLPASGMAANLSNNNPDARVKFRNTSLKPNILPTLVET